MRRFSDWLYQISCLGVALAAAGIFVIFTIIILPRQAQSAEKMAGAADSPDMSFYYSREDLYRMAEAYGEQGRRAYLQARWTFDVAWPIVYTLFLCTAIIWVYTRTFAEGSGWRWANLVPVFGMLFDFLENLSTSLVFLRYPQQTPLVDSLASIFTALKWIFVGSSFVLLVLGIGVGVIRWVMRSQP